MQLRIISILRSFATLREAFMQKLHMAPYHLRYVSEGELLMLCLTEKSEVNDPLVQECNGLVLRKDTYDIVSVGPPVIVRTSQTVLQQMKDVLDNSESGTASYTLEEAEDGTVLRLFYDNGEWHMTTSRKFNAKKLRWASHKTFWQLFEEAAKTRDLSRLLEAELNKVCTYVFVLLHPENRHVIAHATAKLVLVSVRDNASMMEYDNVTVSFASTPKQVTSCDVCNEQTLDPMKRGVLLSVRFPDQIRVNYLCDKPSFVRAEALRANLPSFGLSYLAAQTAEEKQAFVEAFPEFVGQAAVIDQRVDDLGMKVLTMYRKTFVQRTPCVDKESPFYFVLGALHHVFKTREPRKPLDKHDVHTYLSMSNPRFLQHLLNEQHTVAAI